MCKYNASLAGIIKNFSKAQHSCRKCLCSRRHLETANNYDQIHSESHISRTDQMLEENFIESQALVWQSQIPS